MQAIIDDLRIHYKIYCSCSNPVNAETIVFLHGWGTDFDKYLSILEPLANKFRIIAINLPGFGLSTPPPKPWATPDYANIIAKFIDSLKITNPIFVGHSLGGKIAIYLAANQLILNENRISELGTNRPEQFGIAARRHQLHDRPDRRSQQSGTNLPGGKLNMEPCDMVSRSEMCSRTAQHKPKCEGYITPKKLILVGSAGIKAKKTAQKLCKIYSFKLLKHLAALPILKIFLAPKIEAYRRKFGSQDYRNSNGIMRASLVKIVNEDFRHLLPLINCPTLLVWGDADQDTPLSNGQLMQKMIKDAKLVTIQGAGHYCFIGHEIEFLKTIEEFLIKN